MHENVGSALFSSRKETGSEQGRAVALIMFLMLATFLSK